MKSFAAAILMIFCIFLLSCSQSPLRWNSNKGKIQYVGELTISKIIQNLDQLNPSGNDLYGIHFPQGALAVKYAYGPDGMWKKASPVEYKWNYYSQYSSPSHPWDRSELIRYSDRNHFTTARDANGHLLFDFNHSNELEQSTGGYAFHEHNGKGKSGKRTSQPFSQFWYDDNYLARFMSQAYGMPDPSGLTEYSDFIRWKILSGDTLNWEPYRKSAPDQIALDGLYYYFLRDITQAVRHWKSLIHISSATWDGPNQQFNYVNVYENYHLGLMKILTDFLMDSKEVEPLIQSQMIQHSISLRSQILSHQEIEGGEYIGWTSSIDDPETLINIESIAVNVLALSTNSFLTFEPGLYPMKTSKEKKYFRRPHHVLSAIAAGPEASQEGYLSFGPYIKLPVGKYQCEFFLRSPNPIQKIVTLDIHDARSKQILSSKTVEASEMEKNNRWSRFSLPIQITERDNSTEMRTYWHGTSSVDLAWVRIKLN
jgi:hypothetical protein